MSMRNLAARLLALSSGLALAPGLAACGDEAAPPAAEKPRDAAPPTPAAQPSPPVADADGEPDPGGQDSAEDGQDDGAWEEPGEDSAETADAPDAPDTAGEADSPEGGDEEIPVTTTAYPGPCKITWSTGAKLTFEYSESGGKVRTDIEGDGKVDTCGSFVFSDGRTSSVAIDESCDGSVETTIEPSYDDKSNVATASFTQLEGGKKVRRDVTLVEVAGFTGLTPGYPLYAKRKDASVYVRKGLARSAKVKKPWEGVEMKVSFGYDSKDRLLRIKEDHGADGSTDRRFDYRYDDMGNVIAMSVTLGSGDTVQKGRAKLDYRCHE